MSEQSTTAAATEHNDPILSKDASSGIATDGVKDTSTEGSDMPANDTNGSDTENVAPGKPSADEKEKAAEKSVEKSSDEN